MEWIDLLAAGLWLLNIAAIWWLLGVVFGAARRPLHSAVRAAIAAFGGTVALAAEFLAYFWANLD